jgi:tetratricopeptide (TPR) repeat protein
MSTDDQPSLEGVESSERAPGSAAPDVRARVVACRTRLESVELLTSQSTEDAVLVARHLYRDIADILGGSASDSAVVGTMPDSLITSRVAALGARLAGGVDDRSLDEVLRELRALVSHLEREHGLGHGLWTVLGERSRWSVYLAGGAVVALVVVGLAIAMLRGSGQGERVARYDELYTTANSLLSQGKHAEAAQAYRAALAVLPDHKKSVDGYNNLGWALQQQGKLDDAIEAYAAAVKLDPNASRTRNNLEAARTAKAQGQKAAPQASPAPVTPREPGPVDRVARYDSLYTMANSLLFQGKHAEAAQAYRAALAVLPDHKKSVDGYNNLGWALQQQGKLDEAIAAYAAAVTLDPSASRARSNLEATRAAKAQGQKAAPQAGPSPRPQ